MHVIPYLVAYAALLVFAAAVVGRFIMFSKMPQHLRWELYPVAHEGGGKAVYGGSFMEDFEWWKKPRETSVAGELKVMIPEILFLVALKEHNRKMWTKSFPFHFGLYMLTACTVLMVLSGLLRTFWPDLEGGALFKVLHWVVLVCGFGGMILGIFGAIGLLIKRLTDRGLKSFTSPADIFNLVFFIVAFGFSLLYVVLFDRDFTTVASFVGNLMIAKFSALPMAGNPGLVYAVSVVLLSLLLAYIPLTHMSHFVGKYFAYHAVRWGDEPNLPGSKHSKNVPDLLNQNIGWSAPHIAGDGKGKTWAEAATENPAREEEK
ncbi:MAG: hypothetical protein GY838_09750 [bacterium]|nr:hypothetical protein [bacterium]